MRIIIMEPGSRTNLSTKIELAVEMKSPSCAEKVKRVLENTKGITSVDVNPSRQRVILEGSVIAETVRHSIEAQTGMSTVILGQGSDHHNLGAGVAAISFGNHDILGLMRFVQRSPETCVFEGTLDNLPSPDEDKPLFVAVHESGDISQGCDSCGSLLTKDGGQFNGIISQLIPDSGRQAEFQTSCNDIQLSDMIGRCVCVHRGSVDDLKQDKSERLACGIVARASGLFQNSKRFCACDGVTIWEQRNAEKELAES